MSDKALTVKASSVPDFGTTEARLRGWCPECDGHGRLPGEGIYGQYGFRGAACTACDGTGDGPLWEMALIGGVHRDSGALDQSNAQVLQAWLAEVDPNKTAWDTMHCGHWAVGWYDHLIVDPSNAAVMAVLQSAADSLADYPVLSDDHLSELEYKLHADGNCASDCHMPHCDDCSGPCGTSECDPDPCPRCDVPDDAEYDQEEYGRMNGEER